MKSKNLSFFEQHVEKIALGIAGLFFLVVVWFYALANPHRTEISVGGRRIDVGPGNIQELAEERLLRLERGLRREDSPLPPRNVPQYAANLEARVNQRVSPSPQLPVALGAPGIDTSLVAMASGEERFPRYVLPKPPVPAAPKFRADFALMLEIPENPQLTQQYVRLIGNPDPLDFHYVSISSSVDLGQWRRALRQANPPIPEEWWRNMVVLTHVVLERQRLDPATGKWVELTVVEPLPEQAYFDQASGRLGSQRAADLINQIRMSQPAVTQPPLPPISPERPWFPPDVDPSKLSDAQKQLLHQVIQQMWALVRAMEAARRAGQLPTEAPVGVPAVPGPVISPEYGPGYGPGYGPPGYGPYGYGPGPGPGMGPYGPVVPTPETPEPMVGTADQQFDQLQKRIKAILDGTDPALQTPEAGTIVPEEGMYYGPGPYYPGPPEVRPPTPTPSRPPTATRPGARPAPSRPSRPSRVGEEAEQVRIVVHDLTAKLGQTYRYRIRVGFFNPLFHRRQVDPEQLRTTYNQLSIVSDPSPWTEPVRLPSQPQFYLVGASPEQQTTRWEVWRFYGGQWISRDFLVRPGDPIGGVQVVTDSQNVEREVDLSVPAVVVDLEPVSLASGSSVRALLMNLADASLVERWQNQDTQDPFRQERVKERMQREAARRAAEAMMQPQQPQPEAPRRGPWRPPGLEGGETPRTPARRQPTETPEEYGPRYGPGYGPPGPSGYGPGPSPAPRQPAPQRR